MSEHIVCTTAEGVLELTLNRPERKNALTQAMYEAMLQALARVENEPGLRVLLITGAGDSFTSGNDIGDFLAMAASDAAESGAVAPVVRFLYALAGTDVPVVAAVNGSAVGVGVTLLFHCDFVYASDRAMFATPFVDLGLVPEAASSLTMPSQMGYRRAAQMLLLGDRFSAAQMVEAGVVNSAFADGEELAQARSVALRLARKPKRALRSSKRLMRPVDELRARIGVEAQIFQRALSSPEALEAMTAFSEKRAPDFSRFE
jgi:enoyl-CoA hydratase/carnithine racemase